MYEQIVAHIERAIYEGRLRQGQKLPPERQLARDLKASRVAVREALRTLELRGLVEVRQGSTGGYFVREADDRPLVRDFATLFRDRLGCANALYLDGTISRFYVPGTGLSDGPGDFAGLIGVTGGE